MNPTVQAALIAGGSTAVVGVAGFWSTVRATGKQVRGARDARLWDELAAVYVDALIMVDFWTMQRMIEIPYDFDDEALKELKEVTATYESPNFHRLLARIRAFGSPAAFDAMVASDDANRRALQACREWRAGGEAEAGKSLIVAAREAADTADQELARIIAAELRGEP
jgi:hypothetical protein